MLARFHELLSGRSPLHGSDSAGRLSPMAFRRFNSNDLPHCLQLYALNETGRFPIGVINEYEQSLCNGESYHLVAEEEDRIVASGGVSYYAREDIAVLHFGLVHPRCQGKGIGTALLLARLSLLKPNRASYQVLIFAVQASIGFYRRFGFNEFQPWRDAQGNTHPSGHLLLTARDIDRCRTRLKQHGVEVPDDEDQIPFRPEPVGQLAEDSRDQPGLDDS